MNRQTPGLIVITTVLSTSLALIVPAAAREVGARLGNSATTSTTSIPLQVRLASSSGTPVNGLKTITFRLYGVPSGGSALWTETWTAGNAIQVTDGVASVLLGSQTAIPQSLVATNSTFYLGITVDVETEMQPRVQLGSAPIAMTVPDGAISPRKMSAQTYERSAFDSTTIITKDTWFELSPLGFRIPAADVPVSSKALILFDARCRSTLSGMAVLLFIALDGENALYTDAYPEAGQMLNLSLHRVVTLTATTDHDIIPYWRFTGAAGTAECLDRRVSVILLGQ